MKKENPVTRLNVKHYQVMERLMNTAFDNDAGMIYLALGKHDHPVAGVFFLLDSNRITYLISVSTEEGKHSGAMFLLIDHVIGDFAGKIQVFDFEGSSIPGVARFFAGFGSRVVHFHEYHSNRFSFPFNLFIKC